MYEEGPNESILVLQLDGRSMSSVKVILVEVVFKQSPRRFAFGCLNAGLGGSAFRYSNAGLKRYVFGLFKREP